MELGGAENQADLLMDAGSTVATVDDVGNAYGAMAAQYVDLFASSSAVHPDDLDLIERHLTIRQGVVLDVGCGPGHVTAFLRSLGVDARGIDLVPEFIQHARATDPNGSYEFGALPHLPVADRSAVGVLAWYSLIHMEPEDLDEALAELRRVSAPGAVIVVGFFDGDEFCEFDHAVATAHYWPVDEIAARLERAGFCEIERMSRPGIDESGRRAHAAISATAT